jgi:seryl-tRNA synthetase
VLDVKLLRREPEQVRAALARRGAADAVDELLSLDARRRELLPELEGLRSERNSASDAIGRAKQAGDDAADAIAQMREVAGRIKTLEGELAQVDTGLDERLASLPNLPDPTAADQDDVMREWGTPREGGRDHVELLEGRIDLEAGARVAGSRFVYLKGELVFLEFALVRWALEVLAGKGFVPVVPPVLVREDALYGTGMLPDTEQQIYSVPEDGLYLAGTSEVPLAYLHAGQILEEEQLPLRYAGFSTCFRREAGAAGKDTRGIFRVHQFDKVEMFSFVAPEDSPAEHMRILGMQEEILQSLGLAYRVIDIAAGDLGASAARKFDCEAWMAGQGRYREVTSCSNCTDYQARRLKARVRGPKGPEPLHTLNGTAVAVGRTIIAIVESGQRADGSVALPEVLRPYGAPAELTPVEPPG